MAVPPAPDGEAVGDPSDSPDPTETHTAEQPPARTGPLWLLVAAFVVVLGCLVASSVALGRAGWSVDDLVNQQANPQTQRDEVMAVGRALFSRLDTYGPEDLNDENELPGHVERVRELMTSKAFACFEPGIPLTTAAVAQGRYSSVSQVFDVAVSSMQSDEARVLVGGTVTLSQPNPQRPRQKVVLGERPFRYEAALVESDGEWLVDAYAAPGALEATSCEQAPAPTAPPSATPSEPSPGGGGGE